MVDLKVVEHISLLEKIYNKNVNKNYIELLDLGDVLNKYPKQLSGGELKRVQLLLASIKDVNYYLFDEPTASLDDYNKECVIAYLKELSKDKVIIVTSHDSLLFENADDLYLIDHCKIEHLKSNHKLDSVLDKKENHTNIFILPYFLKMYKHRKLKSCFSVFFITISIALICLAVNFNDIALLNQYNRLNQLSSNEIIIFKPQGGIVENNYSSIGNEEPISEEELSKIKEIEHIESVEWRFDCELLDHFYNYVGPEDYGVFREENHKSMVLNAKKLNKTITFDDKNVYFHTYCNDQNYSSCIEKDFNSKKGIYLSSSLAKMILESENYDLLENASITIDINIPVYNTHGFAWQYDGDIFDSGDYETRYFCNTLSCRALNVTLPIKGVLKDQMGQGATSGSYSIYMSQNEYASYINNENITDRKVYFDDNDKMYIEGSNLDNVKIDREGTQTVWRSNSYSIFIDNIGYMKDVVKNLNHMGYSVENEYMNYEAVVDYMDSQSKQQKTISTTLGTILLVGYFIFSIINHKKEKNKLLFFKSLNVQGKDMLLIKLQKNILNFVIVIIMALLIIYLAQFLLYSLGIAYSSFSFKLFLLVVAISLVFEIALPMGLERKI